jgi:biopolymer transport protein TolR
MANVMARSSGGRRRSMSEINMVPFIDVMLVLLIIFMVSAPLITTGVVDLPSVGKSRQRPTTVVEVVISANDTIQMRHDQTPLTDVSLDQLAPQVLKLQTGSEPVPVVISADRNVRYDSVVKVMDALQRNGVQRVGLSVKQGH